VMPATPRSRPTPRLRAPARSATRRQPVTAPTASTRSRRTRPATSKRHLQAPTLRPSLTPRSPHRWRPLRRFRTPPP
jgi:hypothetical protein